MSTCITTAEKANRLRHIVTTLAEQPLAPICDYRRSVYLPFITESFGAWLSDTGSASITNSILGHLRSLLVRELELFMAGDSSFSQGRLFLILTAQRGEKALLVAQNCAPQRNVIEFKRPRAAAE